MNELKVFMFDGRLVTDSREVAEMVERRHSDLIRDIEGYKEVMDQNAKLRSDDFFIESAYQAGTGKSYKCFMLTKIGCDMVANKMTGEKGILFTATFVKKFEAMANFIHSGQHGQSISTKEEFEMQLIGVEYASKLLRVDESSKVKMLVAVHKQHHVPTNHLPVYVDEEVTMSISDLLKEHGVSVGAAKVNTKLIELGLLEIKERPSSKGRTKEFKSITDAGLKFGKNLLSPQNQKETQPHYYPSKFEELKTLLGV